jgi:hypothetical protein
VPRDTLGLRLGATKKGLGVTKKGIGAAKKARGTAGGLAQIFKTTSKNPLDFFLNII